MAITEQEAYELARDADLDWQAGWCLASEVNRYKTLAELAIARYGAAPQAASVPAEPFGQVAVYRSKWPNHATRYEFYPWPQSPYLDNASECHTVYLAPKGAA